MPNENVVAGSVGVAEKTVEKKSEFKSLVVKLLKSQKGNLFLRARDRKGDYRIGVWCNPKHVNLNDVLEENGYDDIDDYLSQDFDLTCYYGIAKDSDKPLIFLNFVKSMKLIDPNDTPF